MNNIKAIIYQSELDFIARCVLDYPDIETGGDFFGFWTKEGNPVVQYVIGPGKKTTRTSTSFYQDIDYLKECGKFLNGKYGFEHIGGWHSHHRLSLAHPSGGDVNTMRNALRGGNIEKFLISISNIEGNSNVTINGFLFSRNNPNDYSICNWQVLDGISPYRVDINKMNLDLFLDLNTNRISYNSNLQEVNNRNDKKGSIEKPEMPKSSFWKTDKGKETIKKMYEALNNRKDITQFEMIQKDDGRLAFRFIYKNHENEIILPHEYPEKQIEVKRKLPNDLFTNIEFPHHRNKSIWSDFDLTLRYIESKFRRNIKD
ncbi:MAG: hypothetical protein IPP32_03225 [Bacteroidetes bacterium]|nr:hypothetical protein [Bacteroidota bacterium]